MTPTKLSDVSAWIEQLDRAAAHEEFAAPRFLRPFHFGMLASIFQTSGAAGIQLERSLEAFATRMHLWDALGLQPPVGVSEHDATGRFLPLTALRKQADIDTYADQLCTIALAQGEVTAQTANSLDIALLEILNNCFDHALIRPECNGMTCAQAWPKGNLAQIAVVDPGVGIRASLNNNEKLIASLRTANACEMATELHVTGNPVGHSGYGLTLAKELMLGNGGNFILASGSEGFSLHNGVSARQTLPRPWQGTIVILEWRTDRPLDVTAVYRGWPLPEGMTDEDYDS